MARLFCREIVREKGAPGIAALHKTGGPGPGGKISAAINREEESKTKEENRYSGTGGMESRPVAIFFKTSSWRGGCKKKTLGNRGIGKRESVGSGGREMDSSCLSNVWCGWFFVGGGGCFWERLRHKLERKMNLEEKLY